MGVVRGNGQVGRRACAERHVCTACARACVCVCAGLARTRARHVHHHALGLEPCQHTQPTAQATAAAGLAACVHTRGREGGADGSIRAAGGQRTQTSLPSLLSAFKVLLADSLSLPITGCVSWLS